MNSEQVQVESRVATAEEVRLLGEVHRLRAENEHLWRLRNAAHVPDGIWQSGGKVFGTCHKCNKLVRLDKPLFGSLHFCEPSDDI